MYKEYIETIIQQRGRFGCGESYCERHHIQPRCLGGTDDSENLVDLFPAEHFRAHQMLAQEYPEYDELSYALWRMCNPQFNGKEFYTPSADEYAEARIRFADAHRKRMSGAGNPNYGKRMTDEQKRKLSIAHQGKHMSAEARMHMSEAQRGAGNANYGKPMSDAQKQKLSIALSGPNNPNYGKPRTEATRRAISQGNKGRKRTPEEIRKAVEARKSFDPTPIRIQNIQTGVVYESISQAAKELNVSRTTIARWASSNHIISYLK